MQKRYLPIILLTFVNIIGFTLLIPVLPAIVRQYAPAEWTGLFYGALITSYALFQFLGAPVLGSLSDKYGRRPLLFLSQLGTTLSWVVFGLAYFVPNIPIYGVGLPLIVIAFSRVVDGITGGNISVANAWVSDITSSSQKTKMFGIMGAVFGVGFIIGPALGGVTAATAIGYLGNAIAAFLISLSTLGFVYFFLPESLPKNERDQQLTISIWQEINIVDKFRRFKDNELVFNLLIIRLFFALVFASYTTVIILFMEQQYSLSVIGLGITLSLIGVFSIFNQATVAHRVGKWLGNIAAIYISIGLIFLGLITLPFLVLVPSSLSLGSFSLGLILFMLNAFVMNLGISIGQPTFKAVLTNHVSPQRQGMITGLDESLLAIGNAVTPLIAGTLYVAINVQIFYLYALLLLAPSAFYYWQKGHLLTVFEKT